jgi:uncharacterized protein
MGKSPLLLALVGGATLLFSAASLANPSFDCGKARQPAELAICKSPELSALDSLIATGYSFLKSKLGLSAADSIAIPFWTRRNRCGSDATCIGQVQVAEIKALQTSGAPISLPGQEAPSGSRQQSSPAPAAQKDPTSSSDYKALTGVRIRARCHMNACQWFQIETINLVLEKPGKSLFLLKLKNYASDYPEGNYDVVRPVEFTEDTTLYMVCSRDRPAVIDGSEQDGWTMAGLAPGARHSIFGYLESGLAIYWAACHARNVQDVYAATALANRLGYPREVGQDALLQTKIAHPTDAMTSK